MSPSLVSGSLPPLINHVMDGARRQFPTTFKMSIPTNFKMGHVESRKTFELEYPEIFLSL